MGRLEQPLQSGDEGRIHEFLKKEFEPLLDRLAESGYDTVQPVTTANETLVFALPREIRPARS